MKLIPLTQGKFAKVSDCDYKFLMQWPNRWLYMKVKKGGYAGCRMWDGSKYRTVFMHMIVAKRKGLKNFQEVDHKNHDKLDCQRRNLRAATSSQNKGNIPLSPCNRSGYKGVSRSGERWWQVHICPDGDGKPKSLGQFPKTRKGKIQAAYTYTVAADKVFGKFANYEPVAHLLDSKIKRQIKKDVLQRLSA
jgi:hypothetical protein